MIVREGNKFVVMSMDGTKRLGGPYASMGEAEKRLAQIEYFKNKNPIVKGLAGK